MEYGQLLFARASLLCCNNLSPPASEQAASHPGIKAPDMIENFIKVMCRSIDALQHVLINKIQTIDEIQSTETLIVLQNPIMRTIKP